MKAFSENLAENTSQPINIQSKFKTGKQVSNFKTLYFTLVTTTLGLATLYMPKLLLETGVILGISMLGFSALLCYITCFFLCQAARKIGANSFPMLTRIILGKYSFIVDVFYILNLIGMIITNQFFVTKTLSGCIARIFFGKIDHNSLTFMYISVATIFAANLTIYPFVTSRNLNKLKKLSKFTLVGFSFALLTIVATYLVPDFFGFSIAPLDLSKLKWANFKGLQTTSGMYLLSMAVHTVIIDIHNELRPMSTKNSFLLILFNKMTCFIIYASISIYGFLAIYQSPNSGKLNNYFLFFLNHQNLDHYVLRVAHILITLSIMFSSIFLYIPLTKFFNSLVDDNANQVFDQEGSVYEVSSLEFADQRLRPERETALAAPFRPILKLLEDPSRPRQRKR